MAFTEAFDDQMGRCILALYRSAAQPAMQEWGRDAEAAAARPGLVISPSDDPFTGGSAFAERASKRLGARFERLDGLGHWWMLEDPARGPASSRVLGLAAGLTGPPRRSADPVVVVVGVSHSEHGRWAPPASTPERRQRITVRYVTGTTPNGMGFAALRRLDELARLPQSTRRRSASVLGQAVHEPRRVTAMTAQDSPDTIVLIHGFWVTPRSWEDWIAHYEKKGFTVLAPAYPGFEVEVEALNADPTPIEAVTVPQIMERLEGVVGGLERPPILIGHSAGGVFTQLLLDRGYGAAGVAINSAPTEGVKRVPLAQVKATFPVLKNPANRHKAVGFTFEQWQYAFTNTFDEERGRQLYERYHIPASGQIFWASALANVHPGKDDTHVNYKNEDRAPLLFISGSDDHLMPPSIQQSNAKHYKADGTITEVKQFTGPHLLPSIDGWEEIADYALEWALNHATTPSSDPA